jgi:hypothetical protein
MGLLAAFRAPEKVVRGEQAAEVIAICTAPALVKPP